MALPRLRLFCYIDRCHLISNLREAAMSFLDWLRKRRPLAAGLKVDIEGEEPVRGKIADLCSKRHNCELHLENEVFTSIFLAVSESHFLTDIMMPTYGNRLLRVGETIRMGYIERAIPYTMECRYLGEATQEGYAALKFAMPGVIYHSNRRGFFRVSPARSRPMRIVIDFGQNRNIDTGVKDISGGGISISSNMSRYIGVGQKIKTIEIEMPDGSWILCSGVIRRVAGSTVGIELDELNPQDRARIFRYVNLRQKEEISARRES
jgi:c-di-GMP-binding flagellar brake protein YcgR